MNYADRVKDTTTTTGTGSVALSGTAPAGYQAFGAAFTTGVQVPYGISDALGNWEIGVGTLTASTTLARTTVLASSNAGALVNFPAGSKDVICTLPASQIAQFQTSGNIAFNATVPLTANGTQYMLPQTVSSVIAFTPAASPVQGASVYVRLTADGTNAPTFTGFTEWGGSMGYDNRAGIVNVVQFFYDGATAWYSVAQAVNAQAVDSVAPTATSSQVANATPTIVTLSFSEAMDQGYTPAASAFTVGGHTVSSAAFASSTVLNLTVSAAFVNGEAARTLAYTQPGSNQLRDLAGNMLASFSGLAITNNVGAAATVPGAPTIGTATGGDASASVAFTAPASNGGSAILDYTVTASPGGATATGTASPITVSGLTNGTAYTFTVHARNGVGNSVESAASNSVTPAATVSSVRLNAAMAKVTESSSAPWTYTGMGGNGYDGTVGSMSVVRSPTNLDSAVIFKVNSTADDLMVGINPGTTINANHEASIWIHGGTYNGRFINMGNGTTTNTNTITPASGDLLRISRKNTATAGDYSALLVLECSKDNGSTWTSIAQRDCGRNTASITNCAIVVPAGASVLSCVSTTGYA